MSSYGRAQAMIVSIRGDLSVLTVTRPGEALDIADRLEAVARAARSSVLGASVPRDATQGGCLWAPPVRAETLMGRALLRPWPAGLDEGAK